jgi:choline transport protein
MAIDMEKDIKDLSLVVRSETGQDTVNAVSEIVELKSEHFNLWSTLGINYSTIGTPLSIGCYLAFNIGIGGSPVYIYGYIVSSLFQVVVCVSLAELAAAFPHSTGRLHKP